MKLISMTDFLMRQSNPKNLEEQEFENAFISVWNYANFLKKPLKKGMFVPCDESDNILDYPKNFTAFEVGMSSKDFYFDVDYCEKYQQAKERLLFDGFFDNGTGNAILQQTPNALVIDMNFYKGRTIEYLLNSKCTITLTPSAQKQIGIIQTERL
jgi:hypothetical protein